MVVFSPVGQLGSVVVARPSDIDRAEGCGRICAGRFDRNGALHALLEHGFDGAVVRRTDIERSRTGEFQAIITA
jgi:hypothetical protein